MHIFWMILVGIGIAFAGLSAFAVYQKPSTVFYHDPSQKNPVEGKAVRFVEDEGDPENADGKRGHLEVIGESQYRRSFYDRVVKRAIDVVLSFFGLILLSPIYLILCVAVYVDDPGPVIFTQKRVGLHKQYFSMHKFRSMKMSTPHDVPTHQLSNPEQYITKTGRFMRDHSLDELPQIWDIFLGNMSVIGPRPALWNQDLLTSERDKYGANDIKPGLTGWAQINGRDELEIEEKAGLDGVYKSNLSLLFDIRCFLGSLGVFAGDNSIVEGGTGTVPKQSEEKQKEKEDGK